MKTFKFFALACALLALIGCKKEQPVEITLSIDPVSATLKVGETLQITPTVTGTSEVTWESSNPAVASVSDKGLVRGEQASNDPVYIIAKAGNKQASCRVTVYAEGETLVTMSQLSASLVKGNTLQLTATVVPAEKQSELVWTSSNEAAASVDNNGLVTAVAKGTATIKAAVGEKFAECAITVTDPTGGSEINHISLKGSDYYIIQLGEAEYNQISSKVIADFRQNSDDQSGTKNLYVWESTYTAGPTSGKNFYEQIESWVSLQVTSVGWSGMGYNCAEMADLNKLEAIFKAPQDYYLHLAMKSTDNASHLLKLEGTAGSGFACIGATAFVDGGVTYNPVANFTRNGDWGEIEINMKTFMDQGLVYGNNNANAFNVFCILSGGVSGTMCQFDAAFIYKKAE